MASTSMPNNDTSRSSETDLKTAASAAIAKARAAAAVSAAPSPAANLWSSFNSDMEDILLEPDSTRDEKFRRAKDRFERPGCVLIIKFHIHHAESSHQKLSITMYLRSLLEACVLDSGRSNSNSDNKNDAATLSDKRDRPHLVKYDDERAFCVHRSPAAALRGALRTKCIVDECKKRFACEIDVSCGLDHGPLVLLVGDYYGNAVNIASKLGEDHAKDGEILISDGCYRMILKEQHNEADSIFSDVSVEDGFVKISKVDIVYKSIAVSSDNVQKFLPSDLPSHETIVNPAQNNPAKYEASQSATSEDNDGTNVHDIRLSCLQLSSTDGNQRQHAAQQLEANCQYTCTMLQSDLSGFTRLTQRYGIYHFLLLVANCRKIFRDAIRESGCDGKIVKYDGDNVIVRFETPTDCISTVRHIKTGIRRYNQDKETDYQIRIKLGVAHGTVCIINHDIIGEAWEDCCTLGEDTAEVGEVLITQVVYDELAVATKMGAEAETDETRNQAAEQYRFEDRCVETDEGEALWHYNMTFTDEYGSSNNTNDNNIIDTGVHGVLNATCVIDESTVVVSVQQREESDEIQQMKADQSSIINDSQPTTLSGAVATGC